ncbi:MAG: hypothetical protein ABIZ72_09155 [Candidatus Limnocylindrales bacterium]
MTSPSTPRTHVPSPGPTGPARHLGAALRDRGEGAGATGRDLVIAATTVVAMAAALSGPLIWPTAVLLLAATLVGTIRVVADVDGSLVERGVPVESLFVPAVAAIGCLGAIRLVPLGLGIVPAVLLTGVLIDRTLVVEARIAAAHQGPTDEDRSRALVAILIVALVAFVGVAAIVPGGLAGREPAGAPIVPLALGDLALLALADAFVAGLLGYRAAALRGSRVREAIWAALTYAAAIAVGAAALRAMGIPRLIGPALLMFLFYLWDTLHATPPTRRRDPRWIWETLVLVGLGAAVAFWNLRLVG